MVIHEKVNGRIYRGWIKPWWVSYPSLPYVNEQFNDVESLAKWKQLGYTQTKFTGDMYDMRNPEPDWVKPFRHTFPWQHFSWSVYRMGPGCVLPEHGDTYFKFKQLHNIDDTESVWRAIVFLEEWRHGHYFEINGNPLTKWLAGDFVVWQGATPHIAANIGSEDRYTLQITGTPDETIFVE